MNQTNIGICLGQNTGGLLRASMVLCFSSFEPKTQACGRFTLFLKTA
jgi:hypothetical protein